ncbi:MAG: hypothetical protein Fur0046_05540 [Cyanobacteria bacterium J069]
MMRVDIGCGDSKPEGFIGIDICPGPCVDIVADISKSFPLEDSSVDELRAYDVIEHLPDRLNTMNEIWRVCKPGARVDLFVPSTDGRGAFQDPTHVSFWNINSFLYFCVDFPPYFNLCQKYGFKGAFKLLALDNVDSGAGIIHVKADLEVIKPIPDTKASVPSSEISAISEEKSAQLAFGESRVFQSSSGDKTENLASAESSETSWFFELLQDLGIGSVDRLALQLEKYRQDRLTFHEKQQLLELRRTFAEHLLNSSSDSLFNLYQSVVGKTHAQLVWSGLRMEPLSQADQEFLSQYLPNSENDQANPTRLPQILLAEMVYYQPHQINRKVELSEIPNFLVWDYLSYLISFPGLFMNVGDADKYYHHYQSWTDYLHEKIFKFQESPFWRDIAACFLNSSNLMPLYFNEFNLRSIYQKRCDIFEYCLKQNGAELEYEFPERSFHRKKIRLGILAAHFSPSAETHASLALYEHLSRDFEVILYSLNQSHDPLEAYCKSSANGFRLLTSDLDSQVATIRADDLDILFIGTNITAVANPISLIAIHRLARIQVTSVASVVTTGFRSIDYYLSGRLTDIEEGAQAHYSEHLVHLEGAAQCFSYPFPVPVAQVSPSRADLGIPEDALVLISAANLYKLVPELLHSWAQIIAAVPNSVLVMFPFGPNWSTWYPKAIFSSSVEQIFEQYGVSRDRLVIADPQPTPDREGLKEYLKLGDVYLDSYPFAGTTSLVDPLDVGLPVVTRRGSCFRSAMGAAIVESIGLPELVSRSELEYRQLAIALSTDTSRRETLRNQIQQIMSQSPPVLNSRLYADQIEATFKQLFQTYQQRQLTQSLHLRDRNLIALPDWQQPEDVLFAELADLLRTVITSSAGQDTTLLVDMGHLDAQEADFALSSVTLHLMEEEELELGDDAPEIALLPTLPADQWELLRPRLAARIDLPHSNTAAIARAGLDHLPTLSVG